MNSERKWIVANILALVSTITFLVIYLQNGLRFIPGVVLSTPKEVIQKYRISISPAKYMFLLAWLYIFGSRPFILLYFYNLAGKTTMFHRRFYLCLMGTMVVMIYWTFGYGNENHFHALISMVAMALLSAILAYEVIRKYVDSKMNIKDLSNSQLPESTMKTFEILVVHSFVFCAWWNIEALTFSTAYFLAFENGGYGSMATIRSGVSVADCELIALLLFGVAQLIWTMTDFLVAPKHSRYISFSYPCIYLINGGVFWVNYHPDIGITTANAFCLLMAITAFLCMVFRSQIRCLLGQSALNEIKKD